MTREELEKAGKEGKKMCYNCEYGGNAKYKKPDPLPNPEVVGDKYYCALHKDFFDQSHVCEKWERYNPFKGFDHIVQIN